MNRNPKNKNVQCPCNDKLVNGLALLSVNWNGVISTAGEKSVKLDDTGFGGVNDRWLNHIPISTAPIASAIIANNWLLDNPDNGFFIINSFLNTPKMINQ